DEHDAAKPVASQATGVVDRNLAQRVLADADRACEREVMLRAADPHGRHEEGVETGGDAPAELVAAHRVGCAGWDAAWLRQRPDRDDDGVMAVVDRPADLG